MAFVAVIFAASGGAFAATGDGGTGGSPAAKLTAAAGRAQSGPALATAAKGKAKPRGKTGPRGPAGPAGKNGANGAAGATGPAGPAGATGPAGGKGETGAQGVPGEPGKQGATGSPWVDNGTLPKGSSESGQWGWRTVTHEMAEQAYVPISFGIPLKFAPEAHFIGTNEELAGEANESPAIKEGDCKGSFEHPEAASGNLCVFAGEMSKAEGIFIRVDFLGMSNAQGSGEAGETGTLLSFADFEPNGNQYALASGTWVVTG